MRRFALVALLLVGCAAKEDDYRVVPGTGGPGGNSGKPDAAVVDGDATTIAGRVCVMTDPRDPASCAGNAANITVTLGGATAITTGDGSFSIARPLGSSPVWSVTGNDIVPGVIPFSASTIVPAITLTRYIELTNDNGSTFDSGEGGLFIRLVKGGAPLVGAIASIDPPSASTTHYDGTSSSNWDEDATGAFGVIWFLDATPASSTVTITPPLSSPAPVPGIAVYDGAITYLTIEVQ